MATLPTPNLDIFRHEMTNATIQQRKKQFLIKKPYVSLLELAVIFLREHTEQRKGKAGVTSAFLNSGFGSGAKPSFL